VSVDVAHPGLDAPALTLQPSGPLRGRVDAPASKSVTNRLLVVAALADGISVLRDPLHSEDSVAMRTCVDALGARVVDRRGGWQVTGTAGRPRSPSGPLDARLSGTTARFVTALLSLTDAGGTVDGHPPLRRRPIGPLVDALATLGVAATATGDGLPVHVPGGGLVGGAVTVDVTRSSQFASALLLVAPHAANDVVCHVDGRSAADYVSLTVDLMADWGADIAAVDDVTWRVRAGSGYRARTVTVEYDASAAAHLFALAMATGGHVAVDNATAGSRQPDARLPLDVLHRMGATVTRRGDIVDVAGPDRLAPVDVSLAAMPDQVTTVATLAALAQGTSVIRDVGVARLHETDRLAALATELGRLGVRVDARPDALVVHGGTARGPARLRTHDDHRLAMAFAALGLAVPGITIEHPGTVAKTYPEFWSAVTALGGRWKETT
jgi:3-phosphoshikimate 1-carboxyvinyltransferase